MIHLIYLVCLQLFIFSISFFMCAPCFSVGNHRNSNPKRFNLFSLLWDITIIFRQVIWFYNNSMQATGCGQMGAAPSPPPLLPGCCRTTQHEQFVAGTTCCECLGVCGWVRGRGGRARGEQVRRDSWARGRSGGRGGGGNQGLLILTSPAATIALPIQLGKARQGGNEGVVGDGWKLYHCCPPPSLIAGPGLLTRWVLCETVGESTGTHKHLQSTRVKEC